MSLQSYGLTGRVQALAADVPPGCLARVVRVDSDRCLVATDAGVSAVRADPLPAVGDWVVLDSDATTVLDALPRWSTLVRRDPGRPTPQVLAANLDEVLVVVPLDRRVSLNRIERELVTAWDTGATVTVVLTKADAAADPEAIAEEVARRCVGADVLLTSAVDCRGLDELAAIPRPDRTVVLFGASGAGKSTLANHLLGDDLLDTGSVRAADGRGRHTTTARHLLPIPGGGVLLDTPGIRGLLLWSTEDGFETAFADVEALAVGCRFRDCAHAGEPGCAVAAAVETDELDPARFASYRKLQRELAYLDRQHDPVARAEQARQWKQIHKSMRHHHKRSR